MIVTVIHAAIEAFFREHALDRDAHLLVAASGGVDSTALLLGLSQLSFRITAAHVNHHLRGDESDGDEQFLREFCTTRGIPLLVADGTLGDDAVRASGIEAAARDVRYARLHELRSAIGARYIATAHQRNDQAETIVMRRMQGAGLAGLRGIHPVRDDGVIRPLLDVSRGAIEAFLQENGVTPRRDSSNEDPRFLRNTVRAGMTSEDLAPLAASAEAARVAWAQAERALDAVDDSETTGVATTFRTLPDDRALREALIVRHIRRLDPRAREVGARDVARIAEGAAHATRISVTKSLELVRTADAIVLRHRLQSVPPFAYELTPEHDVRIAETGDIVRVRRVHDDARGSRERQRIQLPRGTDPRFILRNRRNGDRFQQLGMQRPKKLKDFLIDRKIPLEVRDRIPLVLWQDAIVCVTGVEISETFKVTSAPGERYEVWVEHEDR